MTIKCEGFRKGATDMNGCLNGCCSVYVENFFSFELLIKGFWEDLTVNY